MSAHQFNTYAEMAEEGEKLERALETWMLDLSTKERRPAWVRKVLELLRRAASTQEAA